jgi:hypothetical protein
MGLYKYNGGVRMFGNTGNVEKEFEALMEASIVEREGDICDT